MKVLGVSVGHDSNACLIEDGEIVRYISEERFTRRKVSVGGAFDSMKYCLDGMSIKDVDSVAVSSGLVNEVYQHFMFGLQQEKVKKFTALTLPHGFHREVVKIVDHHKCHAASAYFTSGFDDALIFTSDGIGEKTSHLVSLGEGGNIKPIYRILSGEITHLNEHGITIEKKYKKKGMFSFGFFYGMVTEALGWYMAMDEGKTMGLAPYGDPDAIPETEIRKYMFKDVPSSFYNNYGRIHYHFDGANDYARLAREYGRENLAAAAQKKLEDRVCRFIAKWLKKTGKKNLCTAGGIFLNVKLNQRIQSEFDVKYWPFPLSSDSGLSIGAAMLTYYETNKYNPNRMTHLYYGSEFKNTEIESVLVRNKLNYCKLDLKEIAKDLTDNKIVAWFQGRMEGGPRALGNRSILMSPLKACNKDILNNRVKFREGFRPFCPSVTEESACDYFDGGTPFMITSCNVKSKAIPAVTHVDNTARPQIVSKKTNPRFHALLKAFGNMSGVPVLLNTSLNIMGEPIIRTPDEAIRCFYGTGIDVLVIGDYVLRKGEINESKLRGSCLQEVTPDIQEVPEIVKNSVL